jgi:hypothetical protein
VSLLLSLMHPLGLRSALGKGGSALLLIVAWWKKTRPCIPSRNGRQRRAMAGFPQWLIRFVHAVRLSLLLSLPPLGLRGVRAAATLRR